MCLLGLVVCLLAGTITPTFAASHLSGPTLKLFQAVEVNDMPGVKAALQDGAQLETKNTAGKTAADVAVDKGHFIIAHFLLSARSTAKAKPQTPATKSIAKRNLKPKRLSRASAPSRPPSGSPRKQVVRRLVGQRRFPMPPRKPSHMTPSMQADETAKFGLPPRKPPAPIPAATAVATAPGLKPGDDDLLPTLDDQADQETAKADAPAVPESTETALGPVGRFFDTLLNLVTPDAPQKTARQQPPPKAAPPSQLPASKDETPQETDDSLNLADLGDGKPEKLDDESDGPNLSDLPDSGNETDEDDTADKLTDLDSDLADLDKPNAGQGPATPSKAAPRKAATDEPDDPLAALDQELSDELEEIPKVRRVGPAKPTVQQATPVKRQTKTEGPASSTAGRTVERLQNLVAEKPKEDEFGLPVIEVTGSDQDDDPSAPLAAELDDEKLDDGPSGDDPLAGELLDVDDEKGQAPAPKAMPSAPVQALPAPRRRSPRYQNTMDRLRRLNEAVARDVRVDPDAILSEGRRTQRLADRQTTLSPPRQSAAPKISPRTMPASPVVREKLMQRQTSSSRMADRLERIRRDIYADEEEAEHAKAAKIAAKKAARKKLEMAKLSQRKEAAPPADDGSTGVVSALAKFFKSAEGRNTATQASQEYRRGQDQGNPAAEVDDPRPAQLADGALKRVAEEPTPGQKPGTMAPGFLDTLSQLFTSKKEAAPGWSADVEVKDPMGQSGNAKNSMLKPVEGSGRRAAQAPLEAPADARGGAWTTTVEMKTGTGDPLVLQVSKSPDPTSAPPAGPAAAAVPKPQATADSDLGDLPSLETEKSTAAEDDLPAAKSESSEANLDDLPTVEGEASDAATDDLPAAEGDLPAASDDLPPAEGEEPAKSAAKPAVRKPRPPQPYSDPLRAPDPIPARDAPRAPRHNLPRLAELKPGPENPASGRGKLRLSPKETLAADRRTKYPTLGEMAARQHGKSSQLWPVTSLAKNDVTPAARSRPAMLSRTSLLGATLALGESVSLESSLPPDDGVDGSNQCVKKNRGTTLFCVEPIDWPEALRKKFVVPTILYTGPMAIVRYDQGAASRLHALFPSNEFQAVVEFYQQRYGDPTEIWKRSIAPLAEPRRENPTVAWRSRDPKTNAVTILEVRQYDDTRGGFPDTNRGAVMLYLANSPSIFPQVSSHELMRLKRDQQKQPG